MDPSFGIELPIRYRDLDTFDHVNNAVYGTYLEHARLRYFDRVLEVPLEEREMVLANLNVDFARPLTLEDRAVRIACGVADIGGSSFRMEYRVTAASDDEPSATAETTLVAVEDGRPREIPAEWRERFAEFEADL